MLKNIHPSKISFNKARRYYLSYENNSYEIKLTKEIFQQKNGLPQLIYVFKTNHKYQYTIEVEYSERFNKYTSVFLYSFIEIYKRDIKLEWILTKNFTIDMSDNYKLITMLICNKYNKNNKPNKVLSDKYLMRFIASFL